MIEEQTRRGALLDLIFTSKDRLVRDMKVKGSLGYSDYVMVMFRILQGESKAKSRTTTLVFRRPDLGLFRICLEESHGVWPWREERFKRTG